MKPQQAKRVKGMMRHQAQRLQQKLQHRDEPTVRSNSPSVPEDADFDGSLMQANSPLLQSTNRGDWTDANQNVSRFGGGPLKWNKSSLPEAAELEVANGRNDLAVDSLHSQKFGQTWSQP